jgi:hypothetical protein
MVAAVLAARFLARGTRWSFFVRSSHKETPASTEQAAAFGAIVVAAPQVRRNET